MSKISEKIKEIPPKKAACVAGVALAALLALNMYCKGGVCRINKKLDGKIIVITGGNAGIGEKVVRDLATRGCTIIIGARSTDKNEEVIASIKKKFPDAQLDQCKLDLASKDSIAAFSEYVGKKYDHIDILINNAGVMAIPTKKTTQEGFEMQFGVNHLGHFYLTYLLWNLLKKSPEPRITTTSSLAHERNGSVLDFDDLNAIHNYDPMNAYRRSKFANVVFAKELQRKMDEAGIEGRSVSVHPGVVRTDLVNHMLDNWFKKVMIYSMVYSMYPLFLATTKSPWQGAQTTLYTVLEDTDKL